MKYILLILLSFLVVYTAQAQVASRILPSQSTPRDTSVRNFVWVDNSPTAMNRLWVANFDSLKVHIYNLPWILDTIINKGDARYAQLLGAYSNPAFVNSLSAAKVFGLSSVALTGAYSDLSGLPNLSLYYLASNSAGYISGINSGMVVSALGYTPQAQLNGTGFIKASGTTISFDNSTYLTAEVDGSTTNEIQTLSKAGNNVTLSLSGGAFSIADADSSTTNEIQTLSGSNRTISLTSGGSYTLPQVVYDSIINKPTLPLPWSFNNTPGRSIVTVAAAANGFQVSSTRNSDVSYSITISSTVSLSGSGTGYVVLEICPTNSSTAGDWIEVSRQTSGQSGTLVIGLVLNQVGGGPVVSSVPAGYYCRIRSVITAGTPTFQYNSGQEVSK